MKNFRRRMLISVAVISVCLLLICLGTAVSLHAEHAFMTRVLRENVLSRRAAVELEECLLDLIDLENDRVERVASLHARVRRHLDTMRESADQPEEQRLYNGLESAYGTYLKQWKALPPRSDRTHDSARVAATEVLETEMLKPCQEFEQYNGRRIEDSVEHHERVLRQLAWGMAGIGGFGAFAGLVLGFGVARGVSRSIRRLQVMVQDAAGKLGTAGPEIVLTGEGGDFPALQSDLAFLSERIEAVIVELRHREREVLRAEQLAAVGQLAAGVAHELRNPLMSIKMLVQAGLDDGTGLHGEDLRVVVEEVRRLEASLRTYLDFARPPKPARRPFDLADLLETVAELVRGRAERQRVQVRLDAPSTPVTADPEQLRQVFVNLALNAIDAMPTGGVLSMCVRTGTRGVTVEVSDTGTGIAPEVSGKLFQPFASTKDTGLGLGLVISKRIIDDHQGALTAANRPGGGATFVVRIPFEDR